VPLLRAVAQPTTLDGDTVLVAPGSYFESFTYAGKAITVQSTDGAALTILVGSGAGPVVSWIDSEGPNSALIGFTIAGGAVPGAPGLRCVGTGPFIAECIVRDHDVRPGAGGGATCTAGSSPVFEDCEFRENMAWQGGGVHGADSDLSFLRCQIIGNVTEQPDLPDQPANTFKGGGLHAINCTVDLTDCTISDNRLICGDGGGV